MLDSFAAAVIVGSILGFLSGLGAGGGSLLLIWLTQVAGAAQTEARMINLLFFLPSAAISCYFRGKSRPQWKKIAPAAAAGCLGATLGTLSLSVLSVGLLRKAFGILLLIIGVRELLYKPKKQTP